MSRASTSNRLLRILFVGLGWDYKDPRRGRSFEFTNLWDALRRMDGVDADLFPFDQIEADEGRTGMNQRLLERVLEDVPDLVFFVLFEDEFDQSVLERISEVTTSINWFADDHWRFETFSRLWAPRFNWVATTDPEAVERYRTVGVDQVVCTQWACNHHLYRPLEVQSDLGVTFVGQPHGSRRRVIRRLRGRGLDVRTWGYGWPEGRLTQEELVAVFNRSKINLNLSNASPSLSPKMLIRFAFETGRSTYRSGKPGLVLPAPRKPRRDQIKGRNFEVPGCGGFLLTSKAPGLDRYYVLGREVVTFDDIPDLVEKADYYLRNENERREIAEAGLERTLKDHTYEQRFKELFEKIGLT